MVKAVTVATATATTNGTNGDPNDSALVQSFKAARRVSTPIVAVETPDPAATIAILRRSLTDKTPTLAWDIVKGLRGLNDLGKAAFNGLRVTDEPDAPTLVSQHSTAVNPAETLLVSDQLPSESVVFMHNIHLHLKEPPVIQALWNLRDTFKVDKRMVVLLAPVLQLPAELSGDVITFSEPLPTREELNAVLDQQHKNAGLELPNDAVRAAALDAVVGLSHYTSEQLIAMALRKAGIDVPKLWEHKIKTIQNTPGLSVYKPVPGDTTLDELKGLDNVAAYCKRLIANDSFNLIVFLDEMDKSLAGGMSEHTGDSGVGKDQVKELLTYIQDTKSRGIMLAGIAGSGKTQLAKAMGAASGKPVVMLDLGGAKSKFIGASEAAIRTALKVITATGEGKVLFIGTANRTSLFTPEMKRRFKKQFFFDLPSAEARKAIWKVYTKKTGLTASQAAIPEGFDIGWTGAEIQAACEEAAEFGQTVMEAAQFIVPQAVSEKEVIAKMRQESAGKFLSASDKGWYTVPAVETPQRSIEVN